MKPQRIVILGGTGFVGSHLVPRLYAQGHDLLLLSRNRERHRNLLVLPGVRIDNADVDDVEVLTGKFEDADAVINLVGILNESGSDGAGFRRAHVELTGKIIAACQRSQVRRVLQMSALRAGEGDSHYLRTRGEAEALLEASGLDWTIFRPSVIFGPGDGLFFRFAGLLRLTPALPLARADAKFTPVYVGDVAEAFVRALAHCHSIHRRYELFGPQVMTLGEIVRWTAQMLGKRRWVVGLPDSLGYLQARLAEWLPGKPMSRDNFRSLTLDSVGTDDGLAALGIVATPMGAIIPDLLSGERHQQRLDLFRESRHPRG